MPHIVEASCGTLYRITADNLPQAWVGIAVKKVKGGYADKAGARPILVRKAMSRIVE